MALLKENQKEDSTLKNNKFIKTYNGKDKIIGRPIRLNKQILTPNNGKDYAEVVFLGDCHYGSPQFDKPRFLEMINYCVKNNIYVFLMGDK